ncbi:MAG: hypothetical protein JWL70_2469, partial [Acidimicrobiia bacterium]|nr:hypothetical protein [Acidimicrobiia bacterium]
REYPQYWDNFWTKPGHVGFDQPQLLQQDLIDTRATVVRGITAQELMDDARFQGAEFEALRKLGALFAGINDMWNTPMALELDNVPDGYRLGAGVRVTTGAAANRQLYCIAGVGNILLCDGEGEASNNRFRDVLPGDEVHLDNRAFLAYCYYYRHHVLDFIEYDFLKVDGKPIYQQYEVPQMSAFMSVKHSAEYQGKLLWIHHTHDASLWPPLGLCMKNNVERVCGQEEARKKFRIRWTENAEHVPPDMAASPKGRNNRTWLIEFQPVIEQGLVDLAAWVEQGIEPVGTEFSYRDGRIYLPDTAAERGGIQPVVTVTANGGSRADVGVGEAVTLAVHAEVPPDAGTIVAVKWDFDGSADYPEAHPVDGTSTTANFTTTHSWDRPGTYFATAYVESHREGDVNATARRIPNLASARIVVT